MMELPRFVLLKAKSSDKFLQYLKSDRDEKKGILQFACNDIVNPYNQFELEPSKDKSNEGCVHIRSCYNNKYLKVISPDNGVIMALGEKPEETLVGWECTLFEASVQEQDDTDSITLYIRHVGLNLYTRLCTSSPNLDCLIADVAEPDKDLGAFPIIDVESLVLLPKKVAFKGNNLKYLNSNNYTLGFYSDDIGDSNVLNEVVFNKDGSVCIKATDKQKWWVLESNYRISASVDSASLANSFWPVKIDYNVIAFRTMSRSHEIMFLQKYDNNNDAFLYASPDCITKNSFLTVEEPLVGRELYNIQFNFDDCRIYNTKKDMVMATGYAVNHTDEDDTVTIKLSHTETKTDCWDSSAGLKMGIKASFESKFPFIINGKVELSAEISYEQKWGDTSSVSKTLDNYVTVTVPANKERKVSLLTTTATYDIPFSYHQKDTDLDGNSKIQKLDDGIYRGSNCDCFRVHFE